MRPSSPGLGRRHDQRVFAVLAGLRQGRTGRFHTLDRLAGRPVGHRQAQQRARVSRGSRVGLGKRPACSGRIAEPQQREALGLAGQHQALAGIDSRRVGREDRLRAEVVEGRGALPPRCRREATQPQQAVAGIERVVVLRRLRGGAAPRGVACEVERLTRDEHHRRQDLRASETRQQGFGALHRAQPLLAPGAHGHAVVVPPVARLERQRLAQGGAGVFAAARVGQRVSEGRPALAHGGVERGGARGRADRGRERLQVGLVVDACGLVPEDVRVGESGVGRRVLRRACDGAAERFRRLRQGADAEGLERGAAALPRDERLQAGERRRDGDDAHLRRVGHRGFTAHRGYETVAAARQRLDVVGRGGVVVEHFADIRKGPGERVIGDRETGPIPIEQQLARHQLAARLGQTREHLHQLGRERYHGAVLREHVGAKVEREGPKGEHAAL